MESIHPNWDLDQYILNYSGHGQIQRLKYIALKSRALQVDALKYAIRLIKSNTLNVALYHETVEQLRARAPNAEEAQLDQAWMDNATRTAKATTEKLEAELKNYKNNLIKESIRMGHMDLAEHFYKCGDYDNALKCSARMRDYCTTEKHRIEQGMDSIKIGFQMRNFSAVQTYIARVQNTPEGPDKAAVTPKLRASAALHALATGRYSEAATEFLRIGPDLGTSYNEILSPNDVATYGGLCALAFFDRDDLKTKFLDSIDFKAYLELEPHIKEAAEAFYSARYSTTFEILERYRPDYIADIYLSQAVDLIYKEIRQKALVQAFSPYSTLELATLATPFNTPVQQLATEVVELIENGKINARLDSQKMVLVAREEDKRSKLFQSSLKMATNYQKTIHTVLLNMMLAQNELEVRPERRENQPTDP